MPDGLQRLTEALADRYQIESELGAGGMATVYVAEDLKHHRKVALKVLRPELAAIIGAERFLKEIEVTANLQHPNILALYDSGEADTFLFYVMPLIEGESLRDRLTREKQLSVEDAVRLATQVAQALDYAHRHAVIHRDIKPENILIHDGQALVADFGIALAVSTAGGSRMTETGLSLGTPHYMSPEQATGDRELDARSDVYALGCVTYEMLTGDPPHTGSTVQAIVAKVLSDPPTPITRTRTLVPLNVDAAVQKALAKSPADRFTTAAQFAEALANPSFTLPLLHGGTTGVAPGTRSRLRDPVTALAVIMILVAGWALMGRLKPSPPARVARLSMILPEGEGLNSGASVIGHRLAISPDGSRLVYVGEAPGGNAQLYVRELDRLRATPIPGTEGGRRPFFSPDGTRVGFFGGDQSLRVVSLGGGPPTVLNTGGLNAGGGAWGVDGYIYADARAGASLPDGIVRLPEGGGELEVVTVPDTVAGELYHAWPNLLPGGRGLLFTIARAGAGLTGRAVGIVDLKTGVHRTLVEAISAWYAPTGHLIYAAAEGTLLGAPFDEKRLAITGPARTLAEGLGMHAQGLDLSLSNEGTLVYVTGGTGLEGTPVWVDRKGVAEEIDPGWHLTANYLYMTAAVSPDGGRLAVSIDDPTGQHLWIKDLPRGPMPKLTFQGLLNSRGSWSPDGESVVFVSDRDRGNRLWIQPADGSDTARFLLDRPVNEGYLSPDGRWIVYRGTGGDRHVYAVPRDDTTTHVIASSPAGEDFTPAVSPDGKWVAYVSDESGRDEVYVRPFPDANRFKRQVSTAGGTEPLWAHSSRELFFRNAANKMIAVDVLAGGGFTAGRERVLFSMDPFFPNNRYQRTYDLMPDDQRFVMLRQGSGDSQGSLAGVVVVLNFFEELKAERSP